MQLTLKSTCQFLALLMVLCIPTMMAEESIQSAQPASEPQAIAANQTTNESQTPKMQRIGGSFEVTQIERLKDGNFQATFTATQNDTMFKTLVLESSHVHVAVQKGATLRLSADVQAVNGTTAQIDQVVLFLPGRVGRTPVWMVSRRSKGYQNPPSKLLDLHAPGTDYQVF